MSNLSVVRVFHWLFPTCLFFTLFIEIQGIQYGPSIEFLTRSANHYSSKTRGKTLYLSAYPWRSVVVPLLDNQISADSKTAYKFFHRFHFAQFMVHAPENHRILAVIQTLKLDTSKESMSRCLDRIQFTDSATGNETDPICGYVNNTDPSEFPSGLIGPRYFSSGQEMTVELFIISTSLRNRDRNSKWSMQELAIAIAFTALPLNTDCKIHVDEKDLKMKEETGNSQSSASCSLSNPQSACIPQTLFCNGILNCGGIGMNGNVLDFGLDERNCSSIRDVEAHFYDVDEDSVQADVKYKEELVVVETVIADNIVRYAVIGLSFTVIGILIVSCVCYWVIWWFPTEKKTKSENDSEFETSASSKTGNEIDVDGYKISSIQFSEERDDELEEIDDVDLGNRLQSRRIPAMVKENPDGSRSIVSYHAGRRLTISLS